MEPSQEKIHPKYKVEDPDEASAAELANDQRNALARITRELCNAQTFPELLFFTDYGNRAAATADTYSDLDIRCVYTGSISSERRQEIETHIATALAAASTETRSIELKFQGLLQYLSGVVGEDGEQTITQSLSHTSAQNKSPRIEASSVVATYTYATTKMLSHKVAEVQDLVRQVCATTDDTALIAFARSHPDLQIRPSEILNRIKLDHAGAVDWLHLYVYQLYEVLAEEQKSDRDGLQQLSKDKLIALQFRLAKYRTRIAFGVVLTRLSDEQLAEVQTIMIQGLKTGEIPALLERKLGFASDHSGSVSSDMLFSHIVSVYGKDFFTERELDGISKAAKLRSGDEPSVKVVQKLDQNGLHAANSKEMLSIFDLAISAGGEKRRRVTGSTRDQYVTGRGIEFCLLNLLQEKGAVETVTFPDKSVILEQGEASDDFFFLPPIITVQDEDGNINRQTNGQCVVKFTKNGEKYSVVRTGSSIIGEIGPFLDMMRTATVVAQGTVAAYRVKASVILELLQDNRFKQELTTNVQSSKLNSQLEYRLVRYLLQYFTDEFIATVRDRAPSSKVEHAWVEDEDTMRDPKINRMHQWFVPGFARRLQDAVRSAHSHLAGQVSPSLSMHAHTEVLFEPGSISDGTVFVVVDGPKSGPAVVLDKFASKSAASVELQINGVFGEAALLGDTLRTARATVMPGTKLLRIDAEFFRKLTEQSGIYGRNNPLPYKSLLFHLLAVSVYRTVRNIKNG